MRRKLEEWGVCRQIHECFTGRLCEWMQSHAVHFLEGVHTVLCTCGKSGHIQCQKLHPCSVCRGLIQIRLHNSQRWLFQIGAILKRPCVTMDLGIFDSFNLHDAFQVY